MRSKLARRLHQQLSGGVASHNQGFFTFGKDADRIARLIDHVNLDLGSRLEPVLFDKSEKILVLIDNAADGHFLALRTIAETTRG